MSTPLLVILVIAAYLIIGFLINVISVKEGIIDIETDKEDVGFVMLAWPALLLVVAIYGVYMLFSSRIFLVLLRKVTGGKK